MTIVNWEQSGRSYIRSFLQNVTLVRCYNYIYLEVYIVKEKGLHGYIIISYSCIAKINDLCTYL